MMRDDMHKVIVERPRRGSRGPFRGKRRKNADPADLPSREGIRRRVAAFEHRELNENLSPLLRFLRKQVGRPWNKVYGEISARLRPSSAVKQHVRDHLWDYVERLARLGPRGAIFGESRLSGGAPRALRPGDLYIDPASGLLAAVKPRARKARVKGR